MRLLLDTHVAIWALISPEQLSNEIHDLIVDSANDVFVSAASIWEIAIKFGLKKRSAPPFSGKEAMRHFSDAGYFSLAIKAEHAAAVDSLPPHHADPFDRMIVAQALTEPLRLVTRDTQLIAYSHTIIFW